MYICASREEDDGDSPLAAIEPRAAVRLYSWSSAHGDWPFHSARRFELLRVERALSCSDCCRARFPFAKLLQLVLL